MSWKNAVKEAGKKYRSGKKKKVGATKFVEKGESRSAKPSRTYQVNRTTGGRFKGYKQIGAVSKSAIVAHYKVKLSNLLLKRELAKSVRERRALAKEISSIKRAIRQIP